MQTKFIQHSMIGILSLTLASGQAQTQIWPTSDTNTVNASQFNRAGSIFKLAPATPTVPAGYTGWSTKGLTSSVAAKKDSSVWNWGMATRGGYSGTLRILSPSATNGAAIFDSDYLDNRGTAGNFGGGVSPSPHSGELISPTINATGYSNISVQFNQYFENYDASTSITWSEDNGATWKPLIQLNTLVISSTPEDDVATIKLAGSVGTSTFKIKFVFNGDYYFWIVDDVKLLNIRNDLQLTPFYTITPSYYTPKNQTENMKFMLDIKNDGATTMPNTKAMLNIYKVDRATNPPTLTEIYKDSLSYGNVTAGALIENKIMPGTLTATAWNAVGEYAGFYRVKSDSVDHNAYNNTKIFSFFVSDSIYRKDASSTIQYYTLGNRPSTELKSISVGNYYYLPKGKGTTATSLTARLDDPNSIAGQTLGARLYKWYDNNQDESIQSDERVLVAVADLIVPANAPTTPTTYTFALRDLNTQRWFYPNDTTQYLAMLEYEPTSVAYPAIYPAFSVDDNDYSALIFLTDSLYRSGVSGYRRRYGPILGKSNSVPWDFGTFSGQAFSAVPVVRLNVVPFRIKTDELTVDNKIEIYPNPALDVVSLAVDLPKASAAAVRILTTTGQLVTEQIFSNVQKEILKVDVHELQNGTYLLQFLTPDGMRTKKLTIVK
ncbi:MAG: hypothetical protein RIS64_55 [Bacteroidota bacterium]